jgi:two-component system OmpR family response regulator
MAGRILVADDDQILREFIALGLREQGYVITQVGSIGEFLMAAKEGHDLWVLDRNMPGGDSMTALRDLRAGGATTPALVLTAMGRVEQRIEGFEAGADDYLTKPFSIAELVLRVKAMMRRAPSLAPDLLHRGNLELRLEAGRVFSDGKEIIVTANEWRLLRLLATRPGAVFARDRIMGEVGISEEAGEVAVDHLVSRLRMKLRESGSDKLIRTVRGLGFAWGE